MNKRQQIHFDDILEYLWIQAYREIVLIVKEQNLTGQIISLKCKNSQISAIFVDNCFILNFLDGYKKMKVAEDYSDSVMFEVYKTLFEHYYK